MRSVKICLLGEPRVGKTSLASRYAGYGPRTAPVPFRGARVHACPTRIPAPGGGAAVDLRLDVWDPEDEATLRDAALEAFVRGAGALLAVCDVTRLESVSSVGGWVHAARRAAGSVPVAVVANKVDLPRAVPDEALALLAASVPAWLAYTSAETGEGVRRTFEDLAWRVLARKG